jgi:hypothetical protein
MTTLSPVTAIPVEAIVALLVTEEGTKAQHARDSTPSSVMGLQSQSPAKRRSLGGEHIDPLFVLPKCEMPSKNEYEPVEIFVAQAITEQNKQASEATPTVQYKGLLDAVRFRKDPAMLRKLLLALRTSGNGTTLHFLTATSHKHARLIHAVFRINAFELPNDLMYHCADAQLHLILALVSANLVFLVPALSCLWKQVAIGEVETTADERYVGILFEPE